MWKAWPPKPAPHSGRCGWSQSARSSAKVSPPSVGAEDRARLGAGVHDAGLGARAPAARPARPWRRCPRGTGPRRRASPASSAPRSSERQHLRAEPARRRAGQQPRPVAAGVDHAGVDLLHVEVRAGELPVRPRASSDVPIHSPLRVPDHQHRAPSRTRLSVVSAAEPGCPTYELTRWRPARSIGPRESHRSGWCWSGSSPCSSGPAIAKDLFDEVAPDGDGVAAAGHQRRGARWPIARPALRGRIRRRLAGRARPSASTLGLMNWAIYQSFARIPLGHRGHHRVHRAAGAGGDRVAAGPRPGLGGARRGSGSRCSASSRPTSTSPASCSRCSPAPRGRRTSCSARRPAGAGRGSTGWRWPASWPPAADAPCDRRRRRRRCLDPRILRSAPRSGCSAR